MWGGKRLVGKKKSQAGTKFCHHCVLVFVFPLKSSVEKKEILFAFDLFRAALGDGEQQNRKLVRNNNLKLCTKSYCIPYFAVEVPPSHLFYIFSVI